MAQEELKYKVSIDASEVPAYLESIKSQINSSLSTVSSNMGIDPSLSYRPIDYAPLPQVQYPVQAESYAPLPATEADPSSIGGLKDWLRNSSENLKVGYNKTREIASNLKETAKMQGYKIANYFNTEVTPLDEMSAFQLVGTTMGLGYDPMNTTLRHDEYVEKSQRQLKDSFKLGLSDNGITDYMALGTEIGGMASFIPGVGIVGGLVGMGIGAAVGAGYGIANEVAKPLASESAFKLQYARGLRNYSPYTVGGKLSIEESEDFAKLIANRDMSSDFIGKGIGRDDIEDMFSQLSQTRYFQESVNVEDQKEKFKQFTKDFTDIMHIFRVGKEEVGKVVDVMNESGVIDFYGGNIAAAGRQISSLGMAARLSTEQAQQVFNLGAEQLRGTGITMASGGENALNMLSEIVAALKYGSIDQETIRQLGGMTNAGLTMSKMQMQTLTSPEGLLYVMGAQNGAGSNSSDRYMTALNNIGSYDDYADQMALARENLSDPNFVNLTSSQMYLDRINTAIKDGTISGSKNSVIQYLMDSQKVSPQQAELIYGRLSGSKEQLMSGINTKIEELQKIDEREEITAIDRMVDNISNAWNSTWRFVGSTLEYSDVDEEDRTPGMKFSTPPTNMRNSPYDSPLKVSGDDNILKNVSTQYSTAADYKVNTSGVSLDKYSKDYGKASVEDLEEVFSKYKADPYRVIKTQFGSTFKDIRNDIKDGDDVDTADLLENMGLYTGEGIKNMVGRSLVYGVAKGYSDIEMLGSTRDFINDLKTFKPMSKEEKRSSDSYKLFSSMNDRDFNMVNHERLNEEEKQSYIQVSREKADSDDFEINDISFGETFKEKALDEFRTSISKLKGKVGKRVKEVFANSDSGENSVKERSWFEKIFMGGGPFNVDAEGGIDTDLIITEEDLERIANLKGDGLANAINILVDKAEGLNPKEKELFKKYMYEYQEIAGKTISSIYSNEAITRTFSKEGMEEMQTTLNERFKGKESVDISNILKDIDNEKYTKYTDYLIEKGNKDIKVLMSDPEAVRIAALSIGEKEKDNLITQLSNTEKIFNEGKLLRSSSLDSNGNIVTTTDNSNIIEAGVRANIASAQVLSRMYGVLALMAGSGPYKVQNLEEEVDKYVQTIPSGYATNK